MIKPNKFKINYAVLDFSGITNEELEKLKSYLKPVYRSGLKDFLNEIQGMKVSLLYNPLKDKLNNGVWYSVFWWPSTDKVRNAFWLLCKKSYNNDYKNFLCHWKNDDNIDDFDINEKYCRFCIK